MFSKTCILICFPLHAPLVSRRSRFALGQSTLYGFIFKFHLLTSDTTSCKTMFHSDFCLFPVPLKSVFALTKFPVRSSPSSHGHLQGIIYKPSFCGMQVAEMSYRGTEHHLGVGAEVVGYWTWHMDTQRTADDSHDITVPQWGELDVWAQPVSVLIQ